MKSNILPELHTHHTKTIPDALTGVNSIRTATLADADHHHGPMSYVSSSSCGNRSHGKTNHTSSSTGGDDDIMNNVVQSTTVSDGDPVDFGGTGEQQPTNPLLPCSLPTIVIEMTLTLPLV